MKQLNFRKISLTDKQLFDEFFQTTNRKFLGWDYSFAMIYIWDAFDETQLCKIDDIIIVKTVFFGKTVFFPPFIKKSADINKALDLIYDYCKENNIEFEVNGVDKADAELIDTQKYSLISERNNFDYIYLARDLIDLSGKKYHSKRNFITRFSSKYKFNFRNYCELDYKNVMDLYDKWHTRSVHEVLDLERMLIERALKSYKELDLKIGILESEGKIASFSISVVGNEEVAHVIFEKGDTSFDGVYPMINKLTIQAYFSCVKYINRQEDLGIEGLRKSKLSYNPILLLEKFNVKIKE